MSSNFADASVPSHPLLPAFLAGTRDDYDDMKPDTTIDTPAKAQPQQARHGKLGTCALCNEPAVTHFDTSGRFVGCVLGTDDIVFVLLPHSGAAIDPASVGRPAEQGRRRRFVRAVWSPLVDEVPAGLVKPGTNRDRTLQALIRLHKSSKEGAVLNDIAKRAGINPRSVSECLNWLEDVELVAAREDAKPSKE